MGREEAQTGKETLYQKCSHLAINYEFYFITSPLHLHPQPWYFCPLWSEDNFEKGEQLSHRNITSFANHNQAGVDKKINRFI